MSTNRSTFISTLADQYRELFTTDPEYGYAKARHTPESLAAAMVGSGPGLCGSKNGAGIERTCKALGIKHTYKAIDAFLDLPGCA